MVIVIMLAGDRVFTSGMRISVTDSIFVNDMGCERPFFNVTFSTFGIYMGIFIKKISGQVT
jgi:hypothetical protein